MDDIDKDEIKLDENDQNNVENIVKFIYPIASLYVFEAISFLICFLKAVIIFISIL